MATSNYAVGHPLAVKLWSRKTMREALKQTYIQRFVGAGSDSLIQLKDETKKGPGDRITCALRLQLSSEGVQGDSTLEGNEEALTTYSDNLLIDQVRHAVRTQGKMSEQRVPFSVREEARLAIQDWVSERLDSAFFNQITGNTAASSIGGGHNTITAPSSTRLVVQNHSLGLETSLSAVDTFTIDLLDNAVELAMTATPLIRPLKVDGKNKYVAFLHPFQVTDMRISTTTGQWLDIQKAVYQGSGDANPIYDGSLGEYNGVVIHSSVRVPTCVNNSSGKRAVLCGAQAAVMGYGQNSSMDKLDWVEEAFDYDNQLGVCAGLIYGIKKTIFNSVDFGTIVIATYAAAHTT